LRAMLRLKILLALIALIQPVAALDDATALHTAKMPVHRRNEATGVRRRIEAEGRNHRRTEEEEEGSSEHAAVVIGIAALGMTFILGHVAEHFELHWLPEAAIGILVGLTVACMQAASGYSDMLAVEKFDFGFFMTFLLPPIIFEAGFNLNVTPFIQNIWPTVFFAFIGTFASTFVVGGLVWWFGQLGLCYPLGPLAALTFGSLISATDPVTVIAVFQKIGVKADLFSMVFGESVLNDAVAIVLSGTLLLFNKPGAVVDTDSVLHACGLFVQIFVGSIVIGLVFGLLSAYVFKKLNLKHGHENFTLEAALSFVFPWCAYFLAETLELSGLVAILTCGMAMACYTRYNFSEKGAILTMRMYKAVAAVAETYVFVYLGMALISFPILKDTVYSLVGLSLIACFVGRLHIPIGSGLTNCFRSETTPLKPISAVYQFLMWWSGLRGGVAFALAANSFAANDFPAHCGGGTDLGDWRGEYDPCVGNKTDSAAILQTTMLIAVFTIFVFGGSITKIAKEANVMEESADGGHHKTDAHIVKSTLKEDSLMMRELDKSGALLRFLTNEGSYEQAEDDAEDLKKKAFGEEHADDAADKQTTPWYLMAYTMVKGAFGATTDSAPSASSRAAELM